MAVVEQILYFILVIGVLVLIHELGHFLSAKLFKMRVERFSIGFPPRAFGKQIGETDYCISWLPVGGYVKISGMIDESLDTEHLNQAPEPWEFRAKPIWQRVIVISAGVIMNIFLALAIFWGINLFKGRQYYNVTTVGYVQEKSIAESAGFYSGDKILAVNDQPVTTWDDVLKTIYIEAMTHDARVVVERQSKRAIITVPSGSIDADGEVNIGIIPQGIYPQITEVSSGLPASKVGVQRGDNILKINGKYVFTAEDVTQAISQNPEKTITVTWLRNGKEMSTYVTPNSSGRIGIGIQTMFDGPLITEKYGFFEAIQIGTVELVNFTWLYLKGLGNIITGQVSFSQSVGGPIKIAEMATQSAKRGILPFLYLMAVLSVSLAIINIFPFPALDGGHLFFLLFEAIFRREVPNKIRLVLQQAGMVILLAFMAFVIYNDIFH